MYWQNLITLVYSWIMVNISIIIFAVVVVYAHSNDSFVHLILFIFHWPKQGHPTTKPILLSSKNLASLYAVLAIAMSFAWFVLK